MIDDNTLEKEEAIDNALIPSKGVNDASLFKEGNDITNKIIDETDADELEKLNQLFVLNQKKKQIARTNKLTNLLDLVDNEVIARFTENPDGVEDKYLTQYWRIAQESLNRSNSDEELPRIQINNQTNVNVVSSGLDRESRAKVLNVVQEILKNSLQDNNNDNIIDIEVDK